MSALPPATTPPDERIGPKANAGVTARRVGYAAVVLAAVMVCQCASILPVLAKPLQEYLGIGDRGFGALFSVAPIAGVLSVLLGGRLVDAWGPRRVIRWCLVGIAASMALLAAGGGRWVVVMLGLGLVAFFGRPLHVAVTAYLVRLFPARKRRILSIKLALDSLNGMVYPAVGEGLLWLTQTLRCVSFGVAMRSPFALAALALLPVSLLYRRRPGFGAPRRAIRAFRWREVLPPRHALPPVLLMALHGMGDTATFVWMARFLGSASFDSHPIPPGFVLSAGALAHIIGRSALAFAPEGLGRKSLMIAPGPLGGAFFLAGVLTRNYLLTSAGYVIGAGLWSLEYPALLTQAAREVPKRFGSVIALQAVVMGLMIFVGLNATGYLVGRFGEVGMWRAILVPACAFPAVGLGAALWLAFRRARGDD